MSWVEGNPEHDKASAFFRRILSVLSEEEAADVHVLVVAHLVDSAVAYVPAFAEKFEIAAFMGKPSSMHAPTRSYLQAAVRRREFELDKKSMRDDPILALQKIFPRNRLAPRPRVIILDIGGYFAPAASNTKYTLARLSEWFSSRGYALAGVVEDTQNGHKRYEDALAREKVDDVTFPVFSVARSELKKPENHLVGVAVTFSIEAILRESNIVLQSRRAGVIGFGPIGRSVAHSLRGRGIPVSICEINPIQLAQAAAQGFRVYEGTTQFASFCEDLNLVVSATGAGASEGGMRPLRGETIRYLADGTYVASVTSRDDEIALEEIEEKGDHVGYKRHDVMYNADVDQWTFLDDAGRERSFYLLLGGNAVNFRHEGVIGPAIRLLQGEIQQCVVSMLRDKPVNTGRVQELSEDSRKHVANIWLSQYLALSGG